MDAETYINEAILLGESHGVTRLYKVQKEIFLLSELECFCDTRSGLECFIERYSTEGLVTISTILLACGATDLSKKLLEYGKSSNKDEDLEREASRKVSERETYSYEVIENYVRKHI